MDPNSHPAGRSGTPSSGPSSIIAAGSGSEEDLYTAGPPAAPPTVAGHEQVSPSSSIISAQTAPNPDGTGGDNAFDADMADYPASLASSIRNHVWEGGRRYHAYRDGLYAFPNDEIEQNRDDMKHDMSMLLCEGKFFVAPVAQRLQTGGEVLDLGTGTGIWAMDLGEKFPNARVTGIDLSPIQPNWVPDNVYFNVDDFEDEWVFRESQFDFVHMRHTLHSVRDRAQLLRRVHRHLKPGGYVEFQELHHWPHCDDATLTPDTPYAVRDWFHYMEAGMRALGSDLHAAVLLPDELRAAGFTDVRVVTIKCPMGPWPRDRRLRYAGLFLRTALMDGLRGLSHRPLATGLQWKEVQIEMFLLEVRRAVMDSSFHTYWPFYLVYAQKPE